MEKRKKQKLPDIQLNYRNDVASIQQTTTLKDQRPAKTKKT
jgi:hypothetical protein